MNRQFARFPCKDFPYRGFKVFVKNVSRCVRRVLGFVMMMLQIFTDFSIRVFDVYI